MNKKEALTFIEENYKGRSIEGYFPEGTLYEEAYEAGKIVVNVMSDHDIKLPDKMEVRNGKLLMTYKLSEDITADFVLRSDRSYLMNSGCIYENTTKENRWHEKYLDIPGVIRAILLMQAGEIPCKECAYIRWGKVW